MPAKSVLRKETIAAAELLSELQEAAKPKEIELDDGEKTVEQFAHEFGLSRKRTSELLIVGVATGKMTRRKIAMGGVSRWVYKRK